MEVIYFIVGLGVIVIPLIIMYFLGKFTLKRNGDYDQDTDFMDIMVSGLCVSVIIILIMLLLSVIYFLGKETVDNIIKTK
jgi:uncharacterized BrkB/YihY/UPF0761 family membrane protein